MGGSPFRKDKTYIPLEKRVRVPKSNRSKANIPYQSVKQTVPSHVIRPESRVGKSKLELIMCNMKLDINMQILRLIEGDFIVGPSLNTFKLAMLSTKMFKFVSQIYNISNFTEFARLFARQQILLQLENPPDIQNF